jgi:hypothetical protein
MREFGALAVNSKWKVERKEWAGGRLMRGASVEGAADGLHHIYTVGTESE